MNKRVNINLKSFLALILVSILMLSVASPVFAEEIDNHTFTEAEKKYEEAFPVQGDVLDFSDLTLDKNKFLAGATHVNGDVSTGSYSITKSGNDYTITLQNVNISKLILPFDDADTVEEEGTDEDGEKYYHIKRDEDGKPEARQTHITINLYGTNEINGYGIEGHYVKGITFQGSGALNIRTHLEQRKQNVDRKVKQEEQASNQEEKETETIYYIVPGISVETDSIEDKENEKTGFVIDNVRLTVINPYYWGIICNGDIDVKNHSTINVTSYEGIQKRADAGSISTDKLFVDDTSSVKTDDKTLIFEQDKQKEQERAREKAKYKDDTEKPKIELKGKNGSELKGKELKEGNSQEGIKIYCEQPTVTVTDNKKIDKITVNDERITVFSVDTDTSKTFVVPGYLDCEKIIKVTDMKGNEAEVKFRSNSDHISSAIAQNRKNATCTESGYEELECKCLICGEKLEKITNTLPALGHDYKVTNYSNYTLEKCNRCGNEVKIDKPVQKQAATPKASTPKTTTTPQVTQEQSKPEVKETPAAPAPKLESKPAPEVKKANTIVASNFTKNYSTKAQSFNINARRNGSAKLTYKSNNKNITVNSSGKVTVKAKYIGKATITISSAATSDYKAATKNITVTVNPPSVKLSKLTNKKSKKMEIKWAKNTAVTGYQIQYSTDKNFKKSVKTVTVSKNKTVTKTVSKLTKKKKYYVRVRTYKTVSGVKYYSSWSASKSLKITK